MLIELLYLFLAAIISFILYPFWINFVYRFQMGEDVRPDGPRTHQKKRGTPTMGGLVFILVVALITFAFNKSRTQTLFPVFIAALAGLFGLLEDFSKVYKYSKLPTLFRTRLVNFPLLKKLRAKCRFWDWFIELSRVLGSGQGYGMQSYQKVLFQFGIGGFVSYWTYFKLGWDYIWFPLLGNVHLGFLYPIVIFLLFISVLNSVAFTDGLDGLAGGLSLISLCAYWAIAWSLGYNSLSIFCATFVGALLPFLYFNVYPARVFMGNVGSHVLGAVLTLLAIVMHREVALIPLLAIFLVDGISSPLQQLSYKLTKKRMLRMAPLHHHFEMLGWPETKVVLRFWIFGLFFAFVGIFVALL